MYSEWRYKPASHKTRTTRRALQYIRTQALSGSTYLRCSGLLAIFWVPRTCYVSPSAFHDCFLNESNSVPMFSWPPRPRGVPHVLSTLRKSALCRQCVFACFVRFSRSEASSSLYNINRLVFVVEAVNVHCAAGIWFSGVTMQTNTGIQTVNAVPWRKYGEYSLMHTFWKLEATFNFRLL